MEDRALSKLFSEIRKTAGDGVGDAELLGRFAATGDEAAFELLVRRHQRLVFGVCRRILQDHHDAEDAFQATFLALARKAGGVGKRQAVAAWLFRVAYRAALTARAGRARRINRERPVGGAADAPADPAAAPERRELCAAVDEEVNRLPDRFRTAAVLCYLEGKTVDEAARWSRLSARHGGQPAGAARERLRGRLSRAASAWRLSPARRRMVWCGRRCGPRCCTHPARRWGKAFRSRRSPWRRRWCEPCS